MSDRFFRLLVLLAVASGLLPVAGQSLSFEGDIPSAPESRVYDPDHIYRSKPEVLARISTDLIRLKEEYGFDLYLVVHSGLIGEHTGRLANLYHEAWLSEENEGLIFVMDIQFPQGGVMGRSRELYQGDFMEEGLMPRIMMADLNVMIQEVEGRLSGVDEMELKIESFMSGVAARITERLEAERLQDPGKEEVNFMGVMAVGLLLIGLLVAIASKFLGRTSKKKSRLYRFPDVLVGERLGAPNGGGKISWIDYGSPSGR